MKQFFICLTIILASAIAQARPVEDNNRNHTFALYRVLGHEDAPSFRKTREDGCRRIIFSKKGPDCFDTLQPENYPLDGLILDEKPLLTEDDIVSYDWEKQLIHLKPGVIERLPQIWKPPVVFGVPFVVIANGQRIYLGAFWTGLSSYMANMPTISLDPWEHPPLPDDVIRIGMGGVLEKGEKPSYPGLDPRIHSALDSVGKLKNDKPSYLVESPMVLLKDPDPWVRNSAAVYLGRYGGLEAIAPLKVYLGTVEKEQFKRCVEEAIEFIHQRTNTNVESEEKACWGEAIEGKEQAKVQDSKNIVLQLVGPNGQPVIGAEVGSGFWETREDPNEGVRYDFNPVTSPSGQPYVSDENGRIILPYDERKFQYAFEGLVPRWNISIYHFEMGLGAFAEIHKNAVNYETTIRLLPLCRLHGTLYSSELNKAGQNLNKTIVYGFKGDTRPLLHSSTKNHFDFLVPPGQYNLWILGYGNGVRTKRDFHKTVSIKPGQLEMDMGAIDLPSNKVSSLIGQPAPEPGDWGLWLNGPAVKLPDLINKVVMLYFAGTTAGAGRDMPVLIDLHQKLKERGLVIIVIYETHDDEASVRSQFIEDYGQDKGIETIPFRVALTKSRNIQTKEVNINSIYGIEQYPTNILINKQGRIAGQVVLDFGEAEKAIDALLSQQIFAEQVERVSGF